MPFGTNKQGDLKPQVRAHIKYADSSSIPRAIVSLNGQSNILGCGALHLHTTYSEQFKLPVEVFEKLIEDIDRLRSILDMEFDCLLTYEKANEKAKEDIYEVYSIRIKSKNEERLKRGLQLANQLLKPETLILTYEKYDQVRKKLNSSNFQNKTQDEFNVVITKNAKLNQVKIYGKKRNEVVELLKQILNTDKQDKCEIVMKSFRSLFSDEVFKHLKQEFKGEIKLDFRNKTIKLESKSSKFDDFKRRIEEIERNFLKKSISKNNLNQSKINEYELDDDLCSICYTKPDKEFKLSTCGHLFCFECLKHQFENMDMDSKLECVKPGCNKLMTIKDIKLIAGGERSQARLEEKCSIGLNNYMMRMKEDYKYCNPCNEICRIISKSYTCLNCNKTLCAQCDSKPHNKLTCAELKDQSMFQVYLNKYTKKCPGCKVNIEKNNGCNHMNCKTCGTHFCWLCGFMNSESNKIYDHMRQIHGGIG